MNESSMPIRRIFEAVVDLPVDAQPAAVDALAEGRPELAEAVLALLERDRHLAAVDAAGSAACPTAWPEPGARPPSPSVDHPGSRDAAGIPASIGPYRILDVIGQGGFGVVYRAATEEGLRQLVAVKVLHATMRSENAARRFRREAEILRRLHHPGIAGFFDAGVDAGRPYIVMELVDGLPLTTFCDRNQLTVDDRLRLFEGACDAVQYAHERLVVHRDLKPANILVTADGAPKLVDFGVATFTLDELAADGDLVTVGAERLLTPEYASPEQLRGGHPNDVTVDVFALGVILYELLTGRLPHDLRGRTTLEAIAAHIESAAPLPPSACAGRAAQASSIRPSDGPAPTPASDPSTTRGSTPDRLRRRLLGELDAIVLMAIRPEPMRRYPTVATFVDDLRRHREGQPVRARPDSASYRMVKFARRHRVALGAGLVVSASILSSLLFAWRWARADAAAARAELAKEAERRELAQQVAERRLVISGRSLGDGLAASRLATSVLDAMSRQSAGSPALRVEYLRSAAAAVEIAARLFDSTGSVDPQAVAEAVSLGEEASAAWDLFDASGAPSPLTAVDRARFEGARANVLATQARSVVGAARGSAASGSPMPPAAALALEVTERAMERAKVAVAARPGSSDAAAALLEAAVATSRTADRLGAVVRSRDLAVDRRAAAQVIDAELGRILEAWPDAAAHVTPLAEAMARAHVRLGREHELAAAARASEAAADRAGDLRKSRDHYLEALRIWERLAAAPDATRRTRFSLKDSLQWVASVERQLGDIDAAEAHVARFGDLARQLHEPDPELEDRLSELSRLHEQLARAAWARWREVPALEQEHARAVHEFELAIEAIEAATSVAFDRPPALLRRRAVLLSDLALLVRGSTPTAVDDYLRDQALRGWDELVRAGWTIDEQDRRHRLDPLEEWKRQNGLGAADEAGGAPM